jgi:hypothetical protein
MLIYTPHLAATPPPPNGNGTHFKTQNQWFRAGPCKSIIACVETSVVDLGSGAFLTPGSGMDKSKNPG